MKRKFLSTLLMGALFIASVSVLTSCKDYDDDINQINSELTTLKNSLNQQISDLTALQTTCAQKCDAVDGQLAALEAEMAKKATPAQIQAAIEAALKGLAGEDVQGIDAELLNKAKEFITLQATSAAETAKAEAIAQAKIDAQALVDALKDGKVAEIAGKVQELEGKLAGIDQKFAALDDFVTSTGAALQQIDIQLTALETFKNSFEGIDPAALVTTDALTTKLAELRGEIVSRTDIQSMIDAAKGELQGQLDQLAGLDVQELLQKIATIESTIAGVSENTAAITQLRDDMNTANQEINETLTACAQNVNVMQLFVQKQLTSIVLKPSFYYSGIEAIELPALYDVSYKANAYKGMIEGDASNNPVNYEVWTADASNMIDISNGGVAWYHMNPYSADLEGSKISFITNIAETRAADQDYNVTLITPKAQLTNESKSTDYPGLVPVPFEGEFSAVDALLRAGKLPMVALKYQQTLEDASVDVNSDWGLLAPTQYKDLIISDNTFGLTFADADRHTDDIYTPISGHLTRDLIGLAQNNDDDPDYAPATHQVKFDETFDITEVLETHFTYTYRNGAGVAVTGADKLMSDEIFKALGLEYKYDLITYHSGSNDTDESAHMVLREDAETGHMIAWPVNVDENGNQIEDEDSPVGKELADRSAVGRMPIVRITIEVNGKVASYAYMKLEITEFEPQQDDAVVPFEASEDRYVDCDKPQEWKLTWSEVERLILSKGLKGNVSKNTFENRWTLVGYPDVVGEVLGTDAEAVQYSDAKDGSEKAPADWFGHVRLVEDTEGSAHMQVLKWHWSIEELVEYFTLDDNRTLDPAKVDYSTGFSKVDFTVYVKLEGPTNVWVKLYIPKEWFKFAIGTVDDTKIPAYWFKLNSGVEGKRETKANVIVPNTLTDDCEFVWDLLSAFKQNDKGIGATLDAPAKFENIDYYIHNNTDANMFEFTTPAVAKDNADFDAKDIKKGNTTYKGVWAVQGNSGTFYVLQLADETIAGEVFTNNAVVAIGTAKSYDVTDVDNVTIWNAANWQTIVDLTDDTNGFHTQLVYQKNEVAKDILNFKGHKELGSRETFTAYLRMRVLDCYYVILRDNTEYMNVRFLRPVDMNPLLDKTIKDGVDNGSFINVMELVELIDWRDHNFKNYVTDGKGAIDYGTHHYINYYEVTAIEATADDAKTDLGLDEGLRVKLDPKKADELAKIKNLEWLYATANHPDNYVTSPDYFVFKFPVKANDADALGTTAVTWNASTSKFVGGYIYYCNNSGNVNDFHIYVPLTITYKWGTRTQRTYGVITIQKTEAQAKKF